MVFTAYSRTASRRTETVLLGEVVATMERPLLHHPAEEWRKVERRGVERSAETCKGGIEISKNF
jgi:hypothetical protein